MAWSNEVLVAPEVIDVITDVLTVWSMLTCGHIQPICEDVFVFPQKCKYYIIRNNCKLLKDQLLIVYDLPDWVHGGL